MPAALAKALSAHELWPDLKARDWQMVAQAVLGLDRKLPKSDKRFNVIRLHCNNERRRRESSSRFHLEKPVKDLFQLEEAENRDDEPMVEEVEPAQIFTSVRPAATVFRRVDQATSDFVLVDYEQLKSENKKLTGDLEKLREEFKLMAEQLKSRDEYLQ